MLRGIVMAVVVVSSVPLAGQDRSGGTSAFGRSASAWCAETDRWTSRDRIVCDVREESFGTLSELDIDTGGNGSITVRGVSGSTARVRFRIAAHGRSEEEARRIAEDVDIAPDDGRIRVRGPRRSYAGGWAVDVEVETPRDLPLTLATSNGGITVQDVSGRTRFQTSNGGVTLVQVAGDVRGSTVNGGVTVRLDGRSWQGEGLDVSTTNGRIRMTLPGEYNAELAAETMNGGIDIDFPVTVQGRVSRLNRRIVTTLGSGGPRLQVRTVNGGVQVSRR